MQGTVTAIQQVKRMRGGAQSHLMRCRDEATGGEGYWVVKFRNNPQHVRVLANEMLATKVAEKIGIPVPATAVVEVSQWLVEHSAELKHVWTGREERCSSGLQFGARYLLDPKEGEVAEDLAEGLLARVTNLGDFCGILCLDKWTGNANGRQALYWKRHKERKYGVAFIDQGHCFHAGEWIFQDSPLRGVYSRNAVYAGVRGWESFEPWLSRVGEMPIEELWGVAEGVPPEWYEHDDAGLERLVEQWWRRRERVAELIHQFRMSSRQPFPGWTKVSMAVM